MDRQLDELPFSAIGQILVELESGARQSGTGFLIDRRVVLTAAHVLHSPNDDAARQVVFTPSCRIAVRPGEPPAPVSQILGRDRYRVSRAWRDGDRSIAADYAAIFLRDFPAGLRCNSLSVSPLETTFVRRHARLGTADFFVAGFPSDKPRGTHWIGRGQLLVSPPNAVRHMVDTFRGQSGAPLFAAVVHPTSRKKVPMALGIHSRSGAPGSNHNVARSIDKGVLADLKRWNAEISE